MSRSGRVRARWPVAAYTALATAAATGPSTGSPMPRGRSSLLTKKTSIGGVRSLTFAGAARNGLLVLPIAAAFEDGFELVPLVVVLGMAIEVIGLGVYRLLVPSLTQQSRGAYSRD